MFRVDLYVVVFFFIAGEDGLRYLVCFPWFLDLLKKKSLFLVLLVLFVLLFFFFKQKTAYEIRLSLVGSVLFARGIKCPNHSIALPWTGGVELFPRSRVCLRPSQCADTTWAPLRFL